MSDMFWEIYLFSCAICVKLIWTAFLPLSLIYLTTYLPPVVFNSVFLPPFSLPCLSLSLTLSVSLSVSMPPAKAFSFFSLLCPHYAPICVTYEAWLSVKNNRWKGNRRMQREVRGLMTRVRDMEGRGGERRKRGRTGLRSSSLRDRTKKNTQSINCSYICSEGHYLQLWWHRNRLKQGLNPVCSRLLKIWIKACGSRVMGGLASCVVSAL